ncbi:hypothetical protein A3SI_02968 [Nitritalea halalkaliphila LW7]|uniref:Uncharacterized protein n=1 Tax=Nitritalea halalkaliphila LW7 TaxID=1189621 RepID=I5C9I2_9BACT|nr:hypothetical protein A3SI_02968 [Nitritalea halalkaliphila LW7]
MISLFLFFVVYVLLFFVWLYVLDREIKHGPEHVTEMMESYKKKNDKIDALTSNK